MLLHLPVIRSIILSIAAYIGLISLNGWLWPEAYNGSSHWMTLAAGLFYFHVYEYVWHRYPMHQKIPLLGFVRESHLSHHKTFAIYFRSRDPKALQDVLGNWWIFPSLLFINYIVWLFIIPSSAIPMFFLGVTLHFLVFEICHWFTHVADNGFDKCIEYVPLLRDVRRYQIEYHRLHHERPIGHYHFTPPYTFDFLVDFIFGPMN